MSERVNPALLGFIAGQEGLYQMDQDKKWGKKMAKQYDVDATTVLLYAKTYGREGIEKALALRKEKLKGG